MWHATHQQAKVNSSLSLNENDLILIVEDDGIGFGMEENNNRKVSITRYA